MAKIAGEFPIGNSRMAQYPYAEWMDGNVWQLVRGEDFEVSPEGMRSSLHNYAKRYGLKVRTKIRDESVYVQLIEEDDEPED